MLTVLPGVSSRNVSSLRYSIRQIRSRARADSFTLVRNACTCVKSSPLGARVIRDGNFGNSPLV